MVEKKASEYIDHIKSMFIDYGKPQEINADGEFNIPTFNQFLARNSVAARYKEGRQDLATIDAAMNNFKKMLKHSCKTKHGSVGPVAAQNNKGAQQACT